MHVVIRYTENYEPAQGDIECIDVPFENGLSRHRVVFRGLSHPPGTWALVVEQRKELDKANDMLELQHVVEWALVPILARECSDRGKYLAWFAENVASVEVDGHPFWPSHQPFG